MWFFLAIYIEQSSFFVSGSALATAMMTNFRRCPFLIKPILNAGVAHLVQLRQLGYVSGDAPGLAAMAALRVAALQGEA